MTRFLLALLFAAGAEIAAAQAPPPAQKALLKGDWQAIKDASDILHVSEKLPAKPAAKGMTLVIADRPCVYNDPGDGTGGKLNGSWYLEVADGEDCFGVVSVSATKLEISDLSSHHNVTIYKRRTTPARKK